MQPFKTFVGKLKDMEKRNCNWKKAFLLDEFQSFKDSRIGIGTSKRRCRLTRVNTSGSTVGHLVAKCVPALAFWTAGQLGRGVEDVAGRRVKDNSLS